MNAGHKRYASVAVGRLFLCQGSGRAPEIRLTQSPSPLHAFPAIAAGADPTARDCLNMSQNLSSPK